ncbi:MAG: hypothetical protein R2748_28045 [Bryobacterales bacterium]
MSAYTYWNGEALIKLSSSNVTGGWINKPKAEAYVNKVFSTWRHDSKKLRKAGATAALETLESIGRTRGFMAAISLMEVKHFFDACIHYDKNGKKWTDPSLATYGGGTFFGGMVSDVPWALATFGEAYDANMDKLIALIKKQQEAVKGLKKGLEGKKIVQWKLINDPLKQLDEYTKAIDPLLVMCPESKLLSGYNHTKTLGKFTGAMDDVMTQMQKSGDVATAAGVTALGLVIAKYVPIFGDLYAEAIKGVPNAISFFENIKYERNMVMAKVYGSRYKMYE